MRLPISVLVMLGAVMGCATGPDHPATLGYFLSMNASISDTTPERIRTFNCGVSASFHLPNPAPASGTVRFSASVTRTVDEQGGRHFETTRADTTYPEAVLDYSGLGDDSLGFTLGAGAYTVSPDSGGVSRVEPDTYIGTWNCGPDFPFSQDSTLGAYGLDPNLQFEGVWQIQKERPIG
jgi:hypothetical protein